MFSRTWISKSTEGYSQKGERLKAEIQGADASLIGAGSGLSTSAGLTYGGERFLKYFSDFHEKYGITDMYSGGFYPFPSLEEYWAWWSRHIYCNRYDVTPGKPYADLLELVRGRNYFVLTTNVDHQFQLVGFDKARLFYTQGDYGLWQYSEPCHQETYDILSMFGDRIGRLLFKQTVEHNVMNHILACDTDIDAATYQKMRGMSYQEVVQTHGQISFPEVLRKEKAL